MAPKAQPSDNTSQTLLDVGENASQSIPAKAGLISPSASLVKPTVNRVSVGSSPEKSTMTLAGVVQDVKRTMAALGTDDDTQKAVQQYLNVSVLEAEKQNPSQNLIKGLLKSAADRLDGSITDTLGQPSRVVREWMDAVLMQDIDFKAFENTVSSHSNNTVNQVTALMESAQGALAEGQPEAAVSAWRKLIAVGEASLSSRNAEDALNTFKNAADLAKKLGQPEVLKTSLSGMVKAYVDLEQHDVALKVLQVADRLPSTSSR